MLKKRKKKKGDLLKINKYTINVSKIEYISVSNKRQHNYIDWYDKKQTYIEDSYGTHYFTKEQLIKRGYVVEDKIVYYKPYVYIKLNNTDIKIELDTLEDCNSLEQKIIKYENRFFRKRN